ncbi:MAG: LPS export ABC transporter periplasmic protein LptC [Candidatus Accumulibacter sp.]|jgi:lipopolysaccharide export system protein LptC|nr:LPS export ABC transporter periplasmic protein LptC [Accumulibacter sp.]
MKHWGSAIFPLTLLFTLTALTLWLRYATEMPDFSLDGSYRHDPDYIVKDATLRKIDASGKLQYTLKSPDIRHYPDDDTTLLVTPDLQFLDEKKPPTTMRADRGVVFASGETVDLFGNVRIVRSAAPKDPQIVATMPQLTVLTEEEKAYTRTPVLITQGKSWVKGTGMRVDYRKQTYLLESRASALLEKRNP